jgi:DNA-binding CsgD family transcriptional regulator
MASKEEVRLFDAELRKLGLYSATEDAIRQNDRRWRQRNDQPSADDADISRVAIAGYTIREIRTSARGILGGRKLECFLWYIENPGISYQGIADELGISKQAVRAHIGTAIQQVLKVPDLGLWEVLLEVFGSRILRQIGYDKK